ncbi:MAG: ethanolamine ammonia-lyase subunit EutC [Rhodocyclaceae bacterium]|nr:ethanolamine ammonia-lyase subunit EutC [Rhodocyclaceae bacterium]
MRRPVPPDPWHPLRALTAARIGLGRAGDNLPTDALLRFGMAHAEARDAVHSPLDAAALADALAERGLAPLAVRSEARDRAQYLRRPDLGRRLAEDDRAALAAHPARGADSVLVLADGLSAAAVARHALPLLDALLPRLSGWTLGPPVIALQARVALGDEIAEALDARQVVMLIGERPGLSSPDSLGAYLTQSPRRGRTDAERNCLSNIRPEGLPPAAAASRLAHLMVGARALGASGICLKDESASPGSLRAAAHEGACSTQNREKPRN